MHVVMRGSCRALRVAAVAGEGGTEKGEAGAGYAVREGGAVDGAGVREVRGYGQIKSKQPRLWAEAGLMRGN